MPNIGFALVMAVSIFLVFFSNPLNRCEPLFKDVLKRKRRRIGLCLLVAGKVPFFLKILK